jgi:RHS repeat-associated protein
MQLYTATFTTTNFPEYPFVGYDNANLYDPVIGRFFSPDSYVQAPGFTQSFNRYSYCLNNPLSYTDPSGEKLKWWQWGLIALRGDLLTGGAISTAAISTAATGSILKSVSQSN